MADCDQVADELTGTKKGGGCMPCCTALYIEEWSSVQSGNQEFKRGEICVACACACGCGYDCGCGREKEESVIESMEG